MNLCGIKINSRMFFESLIANWSSDFRNFEPNQNIFEHRNSEIRLSYVRTRLWRVDGAADHLLSQAFIPAYGCER